ncbi:MAG: hypothetical protein HC884_10885 [Chloroflexaceae bacterium]|nr:hypothetical protein [Chloroflexaceae bacterium]
MPNPFDLTYLTESSPVFGPFAWAFYVVQALGMAAGVYLSFAWKERNILRMQLARRLGLVLIALGSMGTLLGVLRLRDIAPFNQRYWFYLMLLADLLLAGYLVYYARVVYPRQQTPATGREKGSRPQAPRLSATGADQSSLNGAEEPGLTPGRSRREARQRRKRKKRS